MTTEMGPLPYVILGPIIGAFCPLIIFILQQSWFIPFVRLLERLFRFFDNLENVNYHSCNVDKNTMTVTGNAAIIFHLNFTKCVSNLLFQDSKNSFIINPSKVRQNKLKKWNGIHKNHYYNIKKIDITQFHLRQIHYFFGFFYETQYQMSVLPNIMLYIAFLSCIINDEAIIDMKPFAVSFGLFEIYFSYIYFVNILIWSIAITILSVILKMTLFNRSQLKLFIQSIRHILQPINDSHSKPTAFMHCIYFEATNFFGIYFFYWCIDSITMIILIHGIYAMIITHDHSSLLDVILIFLVQVFMYYIDSRIALLSFILQRKDMDCLSDKCHEIMLKFLFGCDNYNNCNINTRGGGIDHDIDKQLKIDIVNYVVIKRGKLYSNKYYDVSDSKLINSMRNYHLSNGQSNYENNIYHENVFKQVNQDLNSILIDNNVDKDINNQEKTKKVSKKKGKDESFLMIFSTFFSLLFTFTQSIVQLLDSSDTFEQFAKRLMLFIAILCVIVEIMEFMGGKTVEYCYFLCFQLFRSRDSKGLKLFSDWNVMRALSRNYQTPQINHNLDTDTTFEMQLHGWYRIWHAMDFVINGKHCLGKDIGSELAQFIDWNWKVDKKYKI